MNKITDSERLFNELTFDFVVKKEKKGIYEKIGEEIKCFYIINKVEFIVNYFNGLRSLVDQRLGKSLYPNGSFWRWWR